MKRKRDFEEKESFEKILRSNGKWMKREDNLMQMIRKEYENIITEENEIKRNWIYENLDMIDLFWSILGIHVTLECFWKMTLEKWENEKRKTDLEIFSWKEPEDHHINKINY